MCTLTEHFVEECHALLSCFDRKKWQPYLWFFPRNDKDKVSEYFPVNTVLLGLFDLCTKLFGVNFEASICDVHIGFMHDQVGTRT